MTVKELEEALGMTRANIRFYEKEGFLEPERLENGYRDYSQSDMETLRKIKLLRQLQFDLGDIRALQKGEKELSTALAEREAAFTRDMADLEAARALCRQMEAEGVGYDRMDAAKYLNELDRLSREGTRFPTLQADALPTVSRPWVRFFARGVDQCLCTLGIMVLFLVLLRPVGSVMGSSLTTLVIGYLSWGLLLVVEPLCLSTWGYTPGKWLFGLKVRSAEGGKLTYSEGFARTAGVFGKGEGYNIPLYNLYRNWKSCNACTDGQALPWEEGCSYTMEGNRVALGGVGYVLSRAGAIFLTFLLAMNTILPAAKGPLTVADFAQNYNQMARQFEMEGAYVLDEAGNWAERPSNGSYVIYFPDESEPTITYELEGDKITALRLEETGPGGGGRAMLAVVTLLGAQEDVNPLNWKGVIEGLPDELNQTYENWSVSYRGLTLANEVTYIGYELFGGRYLFPTEGETQSFRGVFTVEIN